MIRRKDADRPAPCARAAGAADGRPGRSSARTRPTDGDAPKPGRHGRPQASSHPSPSPSTSSSKPKRANRRRENARRDRRPAAGLGRQPAAVPRCPRQNFEGGVSAMPAEHPDRHPARDRCRPRPGQRSALQHGAATGRRRPVRLQPRRQQRPPERLGAKPKKATAWALGTQHPAGNHRSPRRSGACRPTPATTQNAASCAAEETLPGRLRRPAAALPHPAGQLRRAARITVRADSKLAPGVYVDETVHSLDAGGQPRALPAATRPLRPQGRLPADLQLASNPAGLDFELKLPNQGLTQPGRTAETEPQEDGRHPARRGDRQPLLGRRHRRLLPSPVRGRADRLPRGRRLPGSLQARQRDRPLPAPRRTDRRLPLPGRPL